MHTRFIPRLLMVSLMLTLALAIHFRASAAERIDWTETSTQENVLVQDCGGYDITSNYTADIAHHLIADNTGDEVSEQLNVDFVGSLGNAETGKSYQYDGHFTRWSNYIQGQVTITDLELRFEVGTPGRFSIALDRVEMDLLADPTDVVKKLVPHALQMELCYVLASPGGAEESQVASYQERLHSAPESQVASYEERLRAGWEAQIASYEERMASSASVDVPSESSVLIPPAFYGETEDIDNGTSWTELDPCDSSPPGQPC
jgi:hypothetical protein